MYLNLDDVKRSSFPAGERNVVINWNGTSISGVRAILRNSDDVMDLLLLNNILENHGKKPNKLVIPYFPYARQDRATTDDTAFSLKVMANLINDMHYKEVHIFEPHSMVTPALINNVVVHNANLQIETFVAACEDKRADLVFVAPDVSAVKRIEQYQDYWEKRNIEPSPVAIALKKRDPATGWLKCTGIYGEIPHNANMIFIDDLCDGGATFIEVAKKLKESRNMYGVFRMNLFVSHGIFSKGFNELACYFDKIGTTDSYYQGKAGWDNNVLTLHSI